MSIRATPRIKREDDKIYVSESTGGQGGSRYSVLLGREETPVVAYEPVTVEAPKEITQDHPGLNVILKYEREVAWVVEDFSSFHPRDAWEKAHELALTYARRKLT